MINAKKVKILMKKERGITLIALIVMIVILVILTAITISNVTGTSLFGLTKNSVEDHIVAQIKEGKEVDEIEDYAESKNAPYSITRGNAKKYYYSLEEVYENAVDGDTIIIEKDVDETVDVSNIPADQVLDELSKYTLEFTKNITIDTNGRTMTRNTSIQIMSGTLTIKGTGKLSCVADRVFLRVKGNSNLIIEGSPTIEGVSHAIYKSDDSTGTIDIEGGYIISSGRSSIACQGNSTNRGSSGELIINNATVAGLRNDKNAIMLENGSTTNLTIGGNSIIANGLIDVKPSTISAVISFNTTGNLTIGGNAIVTGNMYGGQAINVYKAITLTIKDNASIYTGYNDGSRTVLVRANGTILNINTTGVIAIKSSSVPIGINTGVTDVTCNIQSGTFVSANPEPLTQVKPFMTNYPEGSTQQNIDWYYLEDYKTLKTMVAPNLYVVKLGA